MRDPFIDKIRKRRLRFQEIDAALDSSLYGIGRRLSAIYREYSNFLMRFHVAGMKRLVVEACSDAMTFGVLVGIAMLTLAVPAFDETYDAWRANTQYAVTFTDRYGNVIGTRGVLHNDAVPLSEVPDHVIKAVLATEDRRFFEHIGIDFMGLLRASIENFRANRVVQGGSTLTQQLAKNLFLTPERTLQRKIKEAFLALWLEARLSKREILKLYLDRAYLGGGTMGVDAAAEFYFGKSIRDVDLSEAAILAGLFKAPTKLAPHTNLPAARARANEVLDNLVQAGFMSDGEVHAARQHPAEVVDRSDTYAPNYFLDWAFTEVEKLGNGEDFVLTVKTSVDLDLQKTAEASIHAALLQDGDRYRAEQAAMVVVEHDGAVRAMVGGRDYGDSQFNRATEARRQPGSAFKPFVYMTALMNGYTPHRIVYDSPITLGNWSPKNYTRRYRGPVSLTEALQRSINTIPVRLAEDIGRKRIKETARRMGIRTPLPITRAMPLGVAEVTALDMAGAYAAIANGGRRAIPYGVLEIRNSRGDIVYDRAQDGPPVRQILPPEKVSQLNYMMSHIVEYGTGRRARLDFTVAAGKTGTTQAYRDAWFVGYTGKYCAAVWFGNDDFTSMGRMTGGSVPAMTWKNFMETAHRGREISPIVGAIDPRGVMSASATTTASTDERPGERLHSVHISPLSGELNQLLKKLGDMFEATPPMMPNAGLSASPEQRFDAEKNARLTPDTSDRRVRLH